MHLEYIYQIEKLIFRSEHTSGILYIIQGVFVFD